MSKLLHKKTMMDCSEKELEEHSKENEKINELLGGLKNYKCRVKHQYLDNVHKNKEKDEKCELHEVFEIIERSDFTNGVDFYKIDLLDGRDFLACNCHGSFYKDNNDNFHTVEEIIQFYPYDEHGFVNIFEECKELNNLGQDVSKAKEMLASLKDKVSDFSQEKVQEKSLEK